MSSRGERKGGKERWSKNVVRLKKWRWLKITTEIFLGRREGHSNLVRKNNQFSIKFSKILTN